MSRFDGRVALVTGATGGLGGAVARAFAAEGARLVLSDLDVDRLAAFAADLRPDAAAVETLAGDVADPALAPALVERALARFGRLDAAVNAAGIVHPFAKLPDLETATMQRMLAVNVTGLFLALRAQIPAMERQGGGAIVALASAAGLAGAPLLSAYAAAKHAAVGLVRSAAAECARKGVRINALCPSFADTGMVDGLLAPMRGSVDEARARMTQAIPMRRLATAQEVAGAALFLCSDEAGFVTGCALPVDGGLTAV